MNKNLKIGLYILGGLALAATTYFAINSIKKSKQLSNEDDIKKAEDEIIKEAIKSGAVKTTNTGVSTKDKPAPVAIIPNTTITGKVSDAILKYEDRNLVGKKVYSAYDGMTAYTINNDVYTKTKNGQLMGVYAVSKPLTSGGKNIYIKTTDSKNPFIYMRADFLKF